MISTILHFILTQPYEEKKLQLASRDQLTPSLLESPIFWTGFIGLCPYNLKIINLKVKKKLKKKIVFIKRIY